MLKTEELIRIEFYLKKERSHIKTKLEDTRIPTTNKGLIRIYDKQIEEISELLKTINKELKEK